MCCFLLGNVDLHRYIRLHTTASFLPPFVEDGTIEAITKHVAPYVLVHVRPVPRLASIGRLPLSGSLSVRLSRHLFANRPRFCRNLPKLCTFLALAGPCGKTRPLISQSVATIREDFTISFIIRSMKTTTCIGQMGFTKRFITKKCFISD